MKYFHTRIISQLELKSKFRLMCEGGLFIESKIIRKAVFGIL